MAIERVQLTVSSIQADLGSGLTWLKKDDLGYGSIQEKYGATDNQIMTIRKHPSLKNLETTAKIFVIVDDLKVVDTDDLKVPVQKEEVKQEQSVESFLSGFAESKSVVVSEEDNSGADAFANL
jgi:hypothetical protein